MMNCGARDGLGLLCIKLSDLHSNAFGLIASSVYFLDFGLFGLL